MKYCIKSLFTTVIVSMLIQLSVSAQTLIPLGNTVGVCLKTEGLLVTGITEVTDSNGQSVNAAYKAGIRKGDRIMAVDGNVIDNIEALEAYLKNRTHEIVFSVMREDKLIHTIIKPVKTDNGYKIGVWVRDSTAGIGTLTFFNPETGIFAGLGHGISDIDTGNIFPVKSGNILSCDLSEPTKGKKGAPGELNGIFTNNSLGEVNHNSQNGIYGCTSGDTFSGTPVKVASYEEISTGQAYIMSDIDGSGVKYYSVDIIKINRNKSDGKNMVIEVTDSELITKTGGIIQGMSGSPLVQNGKLIGAVTHVFVNDPTRGYGIFIENMLAEAEKIK